MIRFVILSNRQGKTRLTKWYHSDYSQKEKQRIIRELGHMVTRRRRKKCNFVQWRQYIIVYKRYASLYFSLCIEEGDNEILAMEVIHQYVECLDTYFGNVCELDLIFNFDKVVFFLCAHLRDSPFFPFLSLPLSPLSRLPPSFCPFNCGTSKSIEDLVDSTSHAHPSLFFLRPVAFRRCVSLLYTKQKKLGALFIGRVDFSGSGARNGKIRDFKGHEIAR